MNTQTNWLIDTNLSVDCRNSVHPPPLSAGGGGLNLLPNFQKERLDKTSDFRGGDIFFWGGGGNC